MAVGDPVVSVGSSKTLEASGSTISSGSVVQADDASYTLSSDAANWPDAEFYLTGAFTTAPTEGRAINLLARPLDIDGSGNHAEVPEAARPTWYVGSFIVNNVGSSTTQYMQLQGGVAYDLPRKANYYLHNGTDQTLNSGWKLVVVPRNVIPATS